MATNTTSRKRKSQQRQATFRILVLLAILVCANMLASRFHYGFDMTKEKRFTLSRATKKLLGDMKDVAVIDVYLKGKMPATFMRLQETVHDRLQSFKEYSGGHIIVHYIDPFEGKDDNEKKDIVKQLAEKGVNFLPISEGDGADYSEKIIFPYALVNYKGRSAPVALMEAKLGASPAEGLSYSESLLEYKFATAINRLNRAVAPNIAYITGHGESLGYNTWSMLHTLDRTYKLDTFDLTASTHVPNYYDAIIINKPTDTFTDKEKFKIDQYVMKGGHVIWCLDMLHTYMDSLQRNSQFITTDFNLNLDDILFRYGVRVNSDLIEDLQCNQMAIVAGTDANGQPHMQWYPWIYLPYFTPSSKHPIVNNMDAVMGVFVNSIDTIANPEIKKTVLLASSKYSRTTPAPVRVNTSMMVHPPTPEMMNKPYQPVAVLLEGKFHSIFQNRLPPSTLRMLDSIGQPFKAACDTPTSMIVISDGDVFANNVSPTTGPMEMGYWRYTDNMYANKSFLLNCLEYLTDHSGLLEARSKDHRLRLLDEGRVKAERKTWQFVNIGIPILLVLIFASAYLFFRKRKYERKA
jgi:gliding-associated putative ABC transporter substrate-binding component GldG